MPVWHRTPYHNLSRRAARFESPYVAAGLRYDSGYHIGLSSVQHPSI